MSFIFETVLSDLVGEKVELLAEYAARGYESVVIFIHMKDAATSIQPLPHVLVFDKSDLSHPYRLVESYRDGKRVEDE